MKEIIFLTFLVSLVVAEDVNRINLFTMDCSGSFHGGMSERGSGTDFFDMGMNLGMVKTGLDAVVDIIHDHIKCACPNIGKAEIDDRFTPNVLAVLHAIHGINATEISACNFENIIELDSLLQEIVGALGLDHEMLPSTCKIDHWNEHSHCAFKIPISDIDDFPSYFQDTNVLFAIQQCPNSVWPFVSISVEGSFIDNFFNPCEIDSDCGKFLSCGRIPQPGEEYSCWESRSYVPESYECENYRGHCDPGYSQEWEHTCVDDDTSGPRWVNCEFTTVNTTDGSTYDDTLIPKHGGEFHNCEECQKAIEELPDYWDAYRMSQCQEYIPPQKCEDTTYCKGPEIDRYGCWWNGLNELECDNGRESCMDDPNGYLLELEERDGKPVWCVLAETYGCWKKEGYEATSIDCDEGKVFCEEGYDKIYDHQCEDRPYMETRCEDDRTGCDPGFWEEWGDVCRDDESLGSRWVNCRTTKETIMPADGGDFNTCNDCQEEIKQRYPDHWNTTYRVTCDEYIPPQKCEWGKFCKMDVSYSCWENANGDPECESGFTFCKDGFSEEYNHEGKPERCVGEEKYSCWNEEGTRTECWDDLSCKEAGEFYMEWEKEIIPMLLGQLGVFSPDTECDNYDFCSIGKKVQNEVMAFVGEKLGGAYPNGYTSKLGKFCGLPEITETDGIRHQQTMSRVLSTISQIPNIPMHLLNLIHGMVQVDSSVSSLSSLPTSLRRLLQEEISPEGYDEDDMDDNEWYIFENLTMGEWTDVSDVFSTLNVNGDPNSWHNEAKEGPDSFSLMQKTCNHQYNFAGGISLGLKTYFMKIPTFMGFAANLVEDIVTCRDSDIPIENLRSRFLLFDPSFWLNMFGKNKIPRSDDFSKDTQDFFSDVMFKVGQKTMCTKHKAEYTKEEEIDIFLEEDVENADYYNCHRTCWDDNGEMKCDNWLCNDDGSNREYCEIGYDGQYYQNCWDDSWTGMQQCTDDMTRGFCKSTTVKYFPRNGNRYNLSLTSMDYGMKEEENLRRECQKYFNQQIRDDNNWGNKPKPNDILTDGWDETDGRSYREGRYFQDSNGNYDLHEVDITRYRSDQYDSNGNPQWEYMTCSVKMQVRKYYGEDPDSPWEDDHFSDIKTGCDSCYHDWDSRIYQVDCEQEWIDGPPTIANLPATCTLEHFIKTGQCAFVYNNISPLLNNKDVSLAVDIQRCPNDNSDFSVDIECQGNDCDALLDMFSTPCEMDSDCPFTGKCMLLELCDPIGDMLWPIDPDNIEPEISTNETNLCSEKDECSSTQKFRNSLVKAILKVGQKSTSDVIDSHTGVCQPLFFDMEEPANWTFIEENSDGDMEIIGLHDSPVAARGSFTFSPTPAPPADVTPVAKDPSELFVMDCSGGLHFRLKEGPFMRGGMNLGILKRVIDGVVDILHDHVKCACKELSSAALDTSWTPNVGAFINAMHGVPPPEYDNCPADMMQFDKLISDIGLNITNHLPNTCSIGHWNTAGECSFKLLLPIPESLGDNYLYVVLKHCSESSWPFVSVSGQGPIFEDFMKPCSDDSDCGSYSCNHVGEIPSYEDCYCQQFTGDGFCTCCGEGLKPHEDGRCEMEQQPFVEAAIVSLMLQEVGLFRDQDSIFNFEDEPKMPEEETTCTLCEITKNIKTDLMSWAMESMFGEEKTVSQLSFCGLTNMIESVSFNRHRQTMSHISSQLQDLPIKELLNLPANELFGRIAAMFENHFLPLHGRSLLEDVLIGEDHDEDYDEDNDEDKMDLSKELEDVDFDSWSKTQDFTSAEKLDGTYWHKWHEEIPETDVTNMFRVTCDNELIIMGGTNKNGGGYFPNLGEVGKMIEKIVEDIVKCRGPLDSLSIDQIRARFLMSDPSFWLNIFTNGAEDLGPNAYDSAEWFKEMIGKGKIECITRWNHTDPDSGEIKEEEEEISPQCWHDCDGDLQYTSCDECRDNLHSLNLNGSCEIKKVPTMAMPQSCSLKTWMETGMCSFIYDDVRTFTDFNVQMGFKVEKCRDNPGMVSFEINCLGEDCEKMTDLANTGCASDADCPSYATCTIFEVCDPIGDLLWNATGDEFRNPFDNTTDCPQNSDTIPGSSKICAGTANFRNQLVQLITKINGEDVSNVNPAHTGICMPIDITDDDGRLQKWVDNEPVEMRDDVLHIKGLAIYYPEVTTYAPTTASPTTVSPTAPTTAPTTVSPTAPTTASPTIAITPAPTPPKKIVKVEIDLGISAPLSDQEEKELEELLMTQVKQELVQKELELNLNDVSVDQTEVARRRHLLQNVIWETIAVLIFESKGGETMNQTNGDNDPLLEAVTTLLESDDLKTSIMKEAEEKFKDKEWFRDFDFKISKNPEIEFQPVSANPSASPTTEKTIDSPSTSPTDKEKEWFSGAISVFSCPLFIFGLTLFGLIL